MDTFSTGNLVSSTAIPGSAARSAEENKVKKYAALSDRYLLYQLQLKPPVFSVHSLWLF